jgi:hypothetical protein
VRTAIVLCLVAAVVALVALSGEYPGVTAAGRRVALREVLPLALLAWVHLAALDLPPGRAARRTMAGAALGDAALLAWSAGAARPGAPPLALALPVIAAVLLAGTLGLARRARRPTRTPRVRKRDDG